jgi:hypothetical protein
VIGDALASAFGVVEPDATVQMTEHVAGQRRSLKVLLEINRTDDVSYNTDKLIAYDHFLAGLVPAHTTFAPARPLVVLVTRSPRAAMRLLARANDVMTVGLGIRRARPPDLPVLRTHPHRLHLHWLDPHGPGLRVGHDQCPSKDARTLRTSTRKRSSSCPVVAERVDELLSKSRAILGQTPTPRSVGVLLSCSRDAVTPPAVAGVAVARLNQPPVTRARVLHSAPGALPRTT